MTFLTRSLSREEHKMNQHALFLQRTQKNRLFSKPLNLGYAFKSIIDTISFVRYIVRNNVHYKGRKIMQRLKVNQDIRPMSEFRSGVASFLKQVHDTKRPLVITQHGKGVAVLLDVGEFELMQEKIELFEDIEKSITQIEAGTGISHDDAKKQVLKKIRK